MDMLKIIQFGISLTDKAGNPPPGNCCCWQFNFKFDLKFVFFFFLLLLLLLLLLLFLLFLLLLLIIFPFERSHLNQPLFPLFSLLFFPPLLFRNDMYAEASIKVLETAGINFERHLEYGIDVNDFGDLLMSSGLVLFDNVKWISFHRYGLFFFFSFLFFSFLFFSFLFFSFLFFSFLLTVLIVILNSFWLGFIRIILLRY